MEPLSGRQQQTMNSDETSQEPTGQRTKGGDCPGLEPRGLSGRQGEQEKRGAGSKGQEAVRSCGTRITVLQCGSHDGSAVHGVGQKLAHSGCFGFCCDCPSHLTKAQPGLLRHCTQPSAISHVLLQSGPVAAYTSSLDSYLGGSSKCCGVVVSAHP